jgi:hypothetical protein
VTQTKSGGSRLGEGRGLIGAMSDIAFRREDSEAMREVAEANPGGCPSLADVTAIARPSCGTASARSPTSSDIGLSATLSARALNDAGSEPKL